MDTIIERLNVLSLNYTEQEKKREHIEEITDKCESLKITQEIKHAEKIEHKKYSFSEKINLIRFFNNIKNNRNILYVNRAKSIKSNPKLITTFNQEILGYHLLHNEPIKESRWEDINANILKKYVKIKSTASGNHASGIDIMTEYGGLSNKTSRYTKNNTKISSYRLTTVCNNKDIGNIESIKKEIHRRNKSFKFYSILLSNPKKSEIQYSWYLIPENYKYFNPDTYEWNIKLGKIKKNKDKIVGYKTNSINNNYMEINFSMSSQLWIIINIDDIKKFKVNTVNVEIKKNNILTYQDIYIYF